MMQRLLLVVLRRTSKGCIFLVTLFIALQWFCLLYTSDAADDLLCVDLGGRRIIKKKKIIRHDNNALTVI